MDAVILAGGKGTRLGLTDIPKPMVDFDGLPLIHRQLLALAQFGGFEKVYILSGYLGEVIIDYFSTITFTSFELVHVKEEHPKGTAGALLQLKNVLSDRFVVLYGDTFFDIDFKRFIEFDQRINCAYGTLFIHPNDHPYDSDLVELNEHKVKRFLPKPHKEGAEPRNFANAAFYVLSTKIFELPTAFEHKDLGRDVFPVVPEEGFAAYLSTEYIKDIGTPQRLESAVNMFKSGLIAAKNLRNAQKALFLDRDGVINYEKEPFITQENFELYEDVAEFLIEARQKGYLLFIVTNQPSIAKGFITFEHLERIHQKLERLLLDSGVFVDEIKFCPHHPESGHDGEVKALKIPCECRKPGTKMIDELIAHYHIDPNNSWMIGDRYTDIQAGINAHLSTILVERGLNGNDKYLYKDTQPIHHCKSLIQAKSLLD